MDEIIGKGFILSENRNPDWKLRDLELMRLISKDDFMNLKEMLEEFLMGKIEKKGFIWILKKYLKNDLIPIHSED